MNVDWLTLFAGMNVGWVLGLGTAAAIILLDRKRR